MEEISEDLRAAIRNLRRALQDIPEERWPVVVAKLARRVASEMDFADEDWREAERASARLILEKFPHLLTDEERVAFEHTARTGDPMN